jgi:hypothetical protein
MSNVTAVNSMSELASSIIKTFDANADGSLSKNEFASFLGQLLGSSAQSQAPGSDAGGSVTPGLSTLFPSASATVARAKAGTLLGFDDNKLNNTGHTSFKYQVGRILQYYPSTPAGLQQALAEIQELVPGAKIIGTNGDKVDFGDYTDQKSGRIGVVDVLVGASSGGRAWAWQPVE